MNERKTAEYNIIGISNNILYAYISKANVKQLHIILYCIACMCVCVCNMISSMICMSMRDITFCNELKENGCRPRSNICIYIFAGNMIPRYNII